MSSTRKTTVSVRVTSEQVQVLQKLLLEWYEQEGRTFPWRRPNLDAYHVLVAEILLQRTPAERVASVYEQLINLYPSWNDLSKADSEKLQDILIPLGLQGLKVHILQTVARVLSHPEREGRPFDPLAEDIKGIGPYTRNAYLALILEQPMPLLDVNMARVLSRYFGLQLRPDLRNDHQLQDIARIVINSADYLHLNWAILDLSALICKSRAPKCQKCPLKLSCDYSLMQKDEIPAVPQTDRTGSTSHSILKKSHKDKE
jgi:A/G-specific adenine glycosylase